MQHALRQLRTQHCLKSACRVQFTPRLQQTKQNYSTEPKPGVVGSLRKAYDTAVESRDDKSKQKIFKTQMGYLSSKQPVTAQVFLKLLDDIKLEAGLGGMKKHLPWVANNEAMKDFEQQEAIIKALTPAERQSARPLQIAVKKRVARATGADLLAVESLFSHVASMRSVQRVLLRRIDRGDQLPETSEELTIMMSSSGSGARVTMPRPGVKQKQNLAR